MGSSWVIVGVPNMKHLWSVQAVQAMMAAMGCLATYHQSESYYCTPVYTGACLRYHRRYCRSWHEWHDRVIIRSRSPGALFSCDSNHWSWLVRPLLLHMRAYILISGHTHTLKVTRKYLIHHLTMGMNMNHHVSKHSCWFWLISTKDSNIFEIKFLQVEMKIVVTDSSNV